MRVTSPAPAAVVRRMPARSVLSPFIRCRKPVATLLADAASW